MRLFQDYSSAIVHAARVQFFATKSTKCTPKGFDGSRSKSIDFIFYFFHYFYTCLGPFDTWCVVGVRTAGLYVLVPLREEKKAKKKNPHTQWISHGINALGIFTCGAFIEERKREKKKVGNNNNNKNVATTSRSSRTDAATCFLV